MLKIIKSENFNRSVKEQEAWNFDVEIDGVYLIVVSARCKNWRQNFKRLFNDDDLAIQMDDYLFAEIKGKKREFSNVGSWNGNELKNISKKVLFILPLKAGTHKITFWVDGRPVLEKIEIYQQNIKEIVLAVPDISGAKTLDVILKNLAIEELVIKIKADVSSKLELKIDGNTQLNQKYKRYKKWYWYGQELKGGTKEYRLPVCWAGGLHSLEFRGEGQPQIELIQIKIGGDRLKYKIGRVRLWKDIVISDVVNLRSEHNQNSEILAELKDGDELEIINERVVGEYAKDRSEIWHEVTYQDKRGFILSSFVEIEGQEREKIIDLIKEKCWQYDADANIMLAIAARESYFKPFARSSEFRKGIFQLGSDAIIDVKINDAYDYYQNIDGGIRYYKIIEKQFTGRGDILRWRLVAWHDGPTVTGKRASINDNELSSETRKFLKCVLENYNRRDWYHIYTLPVLILLISSLISGYLIWNSRMDVNSDTASVFQGERIAVLQEIYPNPEISPFPNVFLDDKNNEVVFINSEKTEVGRIDVKQLNMDTIFETPPDFVGASGKNSTFIESQYLEYPKNVFYFFVATSWTCGANNCTFAFFRFNADNKKLELISHTVFGGIRALYLSPNSRKLALFATDHGGVAAENDHICIFDLFSFKKQDIEGYFDWKFNAHYIKEFVWKNDNEIQFEVQYSKIPDLKAKRTIWLYNIDEGKSKEIKSELFDLNLKG